MTDYGAITNRLLRLQRALDEPVCVDLRGVRGEIMHSDNLFLFSFFDFSGAIPRISCTSCNTFRKIHLITKSFVYLAGDRTGGCLILFLYVFPFAAGVSFVLLIVVIVNRSLLPLPFAPSYLQAQGKRTVHQPQLESFVSLLTQNIAEV